MEKILFLGAGSESDPVFGNCYNPNMLDPKGIKVLYTAVESCHGCPDLMSKYSKELQSLVDEGNRVVAVLEGGLYFALPSIQATQTTFPIISCPLDIVAYQGFMVPPGHAAIATVGIEKKIEGTKDYETTQRTKAINLAVDMLSLDTDSVDLWGLCVDMHVPRKEIGKYDIKEKANSKLALAYHESPFEGPKSIQIWADSVGGPLTGDYIQQQESLLAKSNALQVRGVQNLAIYAAKILSLSNPELREQIKKIKDDKRKKYEERDLLEELRGGK